MTIGHRSFSLSLLLASLFFFSSLSFPSPYPLTHEKILWTEKAPGWKDWTALTDVGKGVSRVCVSAAGAAAHRVVLLTSTQGRSILHSVCFPVLHLQIRSMGVAWKMFVVFPFFFFNCFCLKFDRLNYCKHSLFLCLRYWMENSIVCCWTVLEIFGQMYVNLAVMAFKANKQTKKAVKMALEHCL